MPGQGHCGGREWAQGLRPSELARGPRLCEFSHMWPAGVGGHCRRQPRVGDGALPEGLVVDLPLTCLFLTLSGMAESLAQNHCAWLEVTQRPGKHFTN